MIVGIDETGNFEPSSEEFHFFTACLVRRRKVADFLAWEKTIGKEHRDQGEVKGKFLTTDQLVAFVRDVLLPPPRVRLRITSLVPSQNSPQAIAEHRRASEKHSLAAAKRYNDAGNRRMAQQASSAVGWIRNHNDQDYLWLAAMASCLRSAFYDAIVDSYHEGYDSELRSIRFCIDSKFLRQADKLGLSIAARTVLSMILSRRLRREDRVGWSLRRMQLNSHPFAQLCFRDGQWWFLPFLEERCDFSTRSRECAEVRMADIVASICARANQRGTVDRRVLHLYQHCRRLLGSSGHGGHIIFRREMG